MTATTSLIDSAVFALQKARLQAKHDAEQLSVPANNRHPRDANECVEFVRRLHSDMHWAIGRCSVYWPRFATGGLGSFADAIGMAIGDVERHHEIYMRFNSIEVHQRAPKLYWSHYEAAFDWNDAEATTCLQWAHEFSATVAEMKAWRRAQRGEDLSIVAEELSPTEGATE